MLSDFVVNPTLATADLQRARRWYSEKLGWEPVRESPGELEYSIEGSTLALYETANAGTAQHTVAAWSVPDLRAEVARLRPRGVTFPDLDLGDAKTVDGILSDDVGPLNAWFQDADGNWLAVADGSPRPDLPMRLSGVALSLPAANLDRAKAWYAEKLGFTPWFEFPGELLIYESGGRRFSIFPTPNAGTARNTLGVWWVDDLAAEMGTLRQRGVVFEEYGFGTDQMVDGVLQTPAGDMAWFTDSEGSILGVGERSAAG